MVARRLLIAGRVQGVGFRWFARDVAERLALTGTVRNLPDGRVEVRVQGEPSLVDEMIARLRIGPPAARVETVTVETMRPNDTYHDFRIVHW